MQFWWKMMCFCWKLVHFWWKMHEFCGIKCTIFEFRPNSAMQISYLNVDLSPLFRNTRLASQFVVFPHFLSTAWLEEIHVKIVFIGACIRYKSVQKRFFNEQYWAQCGMNYCGDTIGTYMGGKRTLLKICIFVENLCIFDELCF